MDAFSASLMADKREIIFAPTVYKFQTFAQMAEEVKLNERDVVLTNEFIYTPFMKDLGLKCHYVFQEKFGAGEPSEEMIQVMYDAIPYDSYDRVIAVGGQTVEIDYDTNTVYVDGEPINQDFILEPMVQPSNPAMQQTYWEVPEGSVFVMGDNRNNSLDSRDDELGPVDNRYILGKAIYTLLPAEHAGAIEHPTL